jgi:hypothetical protein
MNRKEELIKELKFNLCEDCQSLNEILGFILNREQSIREELAQNIEYQDSLHEKIEMHESTIAEYDRSEKYWHDLCLVNQEKCLKLLAKISEARKVLEEALDKEDRTGKTDMWKVSGMLGDAIDKALGVLK